MRSSRQFADCRIGANDVDLDRFCEATRAYCTLLRSFGGFTRMSIGQVNKHLKMLDSARKRFPLKGQRRVSMKALLEAEKAQTGLHAPHGVLGDGTGAMGLLWIRRGLEFWAETFEIAAKALSSNLAGRKEAARRRRWLFFWKRKRRAEGSTFKEQADAGYAASVRPFHGWVARNAFMASMRSPPDWEDLMVCAKLAESREQLAAELKRWATSLREVIKTMHDVHVRYDLEDTRKTV